LVVHGGAREDLDGSHELIVWLASISFSFRKNAAHGIIRAAFLLFALT
jgi:hypothetical protein